MNLLPKMVQFPQHHLLELNYLTDALFLIVPLTDYLELLFLYLLLFCGFRHFNAWGKLFWLLAGK